MPYTKTTWADRQVQRPLTFTQTTNADGSITLSPAEGTVTQAGTPITAAILNNLETQYDQAMSDVAASYAKKSLAAGFYGMTGYNGWASTVPGDFYGIQYAKDSLGFVTLRGVVQGGTAGTRISSLPAGYRPAHTMAFPVITYNGTTRVDVYANGDVMHVGTYSSWVFLDGIRFYAEQ